MITLDDYKPRLATTVATATFPLAVRVVDTLLTERNEMVVIDAIADSVTSLFPDLEGEPAVTTAQEAAFNVGFAVCWLLMMAVNGKEER